GIAHEVKNTIVGLLGALDEIQSNFETLVSHLNGWYRSGQPVPHSEKQELFFGLESALDAIGYAKTASIHIDDVVHTLSQLSKGQHAQMTRISLTTFLNRMISISMLRTYGDRVRTQALDEPPELKVDKDVQAVRGHTELLKAVFINLFKNAIFAMDHVEHKKIRIHVTQDSPDKVRIEFSDNGCGIPPEVLPKIFDYGFTTKGSEGEGKGLHNVKMIIEKEHKGSIEVQSEVGKGSTFIIKLPVWKDRPNE
ncbi:MAG: HAMP domain-containing sensor histidine kinase, partial [Candidatus Omnitrophota bacterium]